VPHAKYSHCSACARDGLASFAAAALHSASAKDEASSRCVRSVGRKLTRPSKQPAGALKKNDGLSGKLAGGPANLVAALLARLEPSRCSRFSLIALGHCEDSQTWPRDYVRPESELWARCFACRPGHRLSRETDQLCFAALTNRPASLTRPSWSETSSSGYTRNCRSRPCTLASQFSRSALPSETQNDWLSARAAAPEHRPADPAQVASAARTIGFAVGWHERPARLTVLVPARLWPRLANRQLRQHTLCVRSLVPRSLLYSFIAPTLLTREPLRCGNKATHNVALSALSLLRCHADC